MTDKYNLNVLLLIFAVELSQPRLLNIGGSK